LRESTLSLGTTRFEMLGMLLRQTLPGLVTALLLAFGRAIGDGASVFHRRLTDRIPWISIPAGGVAADAIFPAQRTVQGSADPSCVGADLDSDHPGHQPGAQVISRRLGRNVIR
jgi:phosphate transport system permease protein